MKLQFFIANLYTLFMLKYVSNYSSTELFVSFIMKSIDLSDHEFNIKMNFFEF